MIKKRFWTAFLLTLFFGASAQAKPMLDHPPEIPENTDFIRSLDIDTFIGAMNAEGHGMHSGRFRLRYRDPDNNAFVGLLGGVHHFNRSLTLGDPNKPDTASVLGNWGGLFGIVRGRHLWELDLMGSNMSLRLGAAVALVGEHQLGRSTIFYHRLETNVYTNDAFFELDSGLYWMWSRRVGLSAGYRYFGSQHIDRSGPHMGLRFYFESPKIPFIFPSLG